MDVSSQKKDIIGAIVIAAALIGIAFWFSNPTARLASALSTDELLRAYVEQDTDADGLPDWQEKVYGTDPSDPESVEAGITDLEAVAQGLVQPAFISEPAPEPITESAIPGKDPSAGSLTERFSTQFIEAYFAAGGGKNISEEEQATIISDLITTFATEAGTMIESPYTRVSLHISSDVDPITYIGQVEALMVAKLPTENSDMPLLANALIEKQDKAAGARLRALATTYGSIAKDLLAIPVPSELADTHLLLLRSYDRVGRAGNTLANYETDPIAALGALSVFVPAREDVVTAVKAYATVVLREGEPAPGAPGSLSVNFARAQEQQ